MCAAAVQYGQSKGGLIVPGYSEARKNANRNWDSKNLDRISVALPKGGKDALRAHAESMVFLDAC